MRKNCSKDVSREHRIEILFVFGVFLFLLFVVLYAAIQFLVG